MQNLKDKIENLIAGILTFLLTLGAILAIPALYVGFFILGVTINYFTVKYGWHAVTGYYPYNVLAMAVVLSVASTLMSLNNKGVIKDILPLFGVCYVILLLLGIWDFFFGTIFGK
jgi:hypothetical protein